MLNSASFNDFDSETRFVRGESHTRFCTQCVIMTPAGRRGGGGRGLRYKTYPISNLLRCHFIYLIIDGKTFHISKTS